MGYLAFGEATHDIITFNLSPGWSTPAVKAALCLGLFLTFPPMMVPVHQIIERSLAKKVRWVSTVDEGCQYQDMAVASSVHVQVRPQH